MLYFISSVAVHFLPNYLFFLPYLLLHFPGSYDIFLFLCIFVYIFKDYKTAILLIMLFGYLVALKNRNNHQFHFKVEKEDMDVVTENVNYFLIFLAIKNLILLGISILG